MTRRIVQVGSRRIIFSPLEQPPLANRWQALVKIAVVDEMTGAPPANEVTIEIGDKEMIPVVSSDGFGGLVGIPIRSFPNLRNQFYEFELVISANGYVPQTVKVTVDQDSSFPDRFIPADHSVPPKGPVELHREPTVIGGRTVRFVGGSSTPLGGTIVSLTEIQRTPNSTAAPPNLVALVPPVYEERAAVNQFVRRRDVVVIGTNKTLLDDVLVGENPIRLSDRLGLAVGDLIQLDAGDPELTEVIAIANIDTSVPPDQPATITLDFAVSQSHRRGASVFQLNVLPAGPQQQITVLAASGDSCVFLDGLAGLGGADEVEIIGPPRSEYHRVVSFNVVSDGDGYFRLPPLSRVAQFKIHAERLVGPQLFATTIAFRPDYQQCENRLDLVLEPP